MDKEKQNQIIKLSSKERKILKGIDKSSKWEDITGVEDINKEIINLDIYKDFIGLGCSRYLNESGENGKLDIEEMFRNCREAEKVRIRVNKKQKKEQSEGKRAGKAGLTKGNIGSNVREQTRSMTKEIDSKQEKKENSFVSGARKIGNEVIDGLTGSVKGGDWKAVVARIGLKYGLKGLFGLVLGIVEMSIDNPIGAIGLTAGMIGTLSQIYAYVYETETGNKVIGNVKDWFMGKLNELYDYLMGKDIKVLKKKKKKPFDRGGSSKKDDDDDDDDDSGDTGEDFSIDFDELDSYESETKEEDKGEEKKEQQDLAPQQQQAPADTVSSQIMSMLSSNLAQAQSALVNTNNERLFQQNQQQSNPLSTPQQTAPRPSTTPPNPTQDLRTPQPQENLSGSSILGDLGILATAGSAYAGVNSFMNRMRQPSASALARQANIDYANEPIFPQPQQPQTQPLQPPPQERRALNDPVGEEEIRRSAEEQQQRREEQRREQEAQRQIDEMDMRGRGWMFGLGLGDTGGGGGKIPATQSIIPMWNRQTQDTQTELTSLQLQQDAQEQQQLLTAIELQAEVARENSVKVAEENERLKAELELITAQEGQGEARKMTKGEAQVIDENNAILGQYGLGIQQRPPPAEMSLQEQSPPPDIAPPLSGEPAVEEPAEQTLVRGEAEQSAIDRALALETVMGQRRGKPSRREGAPPIASQFLREVFDIEGNNILISQLRRYIQQLEENDLKQSLNEILNEINDRTSRERGKGGTGDYRLNSREIQAVATLINDAQMEARRPPRQPREEMTGGVRRIRIKRGGGRGAGKKEEEDKGKKK
jgi:hypothetical protein